MPIPWLIGTAIVVGVAALMRESKEDREQREREERWAEQDRIREKAERKIQRSKEAEEKRQKEDMARDLERFSVAKGKSLADKYAIASTDIVSIAKLSIHNPEQCKTEFTQAFLQSGKLLDMENQKMLLESQLQEIDALSNLISKAG